MRFFTTALRSRRPPSLLCCEKACPKAMGAAFEDVDQNSVQSAMAKSDSILRRPAPLCNRSSRDDNTEARWRRCRDRRLRPAARRFRAKGEHFVLPRKADDRAASLVTSYPSVRAAWAELLRGNLDMLFEVNADALDSLQSSSDVAVFSFIRHYQYLLMFGAHAPVFQSAEVRRELERRDRSQCPVARRIEWSRRRLLWPGAATTLGGWQRRAKVWIRCEAGRESSSSAPSIHVPRRRRLRL